MRGWTGPLNLALLLSAITMGGCSMQTLTTALSGRQREIVAESRADGPPPVCSVWRAIDYDSAHDTPETVRQAKGNNAAREGYGC